MHAYLEGALELQGEQVRVERKEVEAALPDEGDLAPDAFVLQDALADEGAVGHEVQLVVAGGHGAAAVC